MGGETRPGQHKPMGIIDSQGLIKAAGSLRTMLREAGKRVGSSLRGEAVCSGGDDPTGRRDFCSFFSAQCHSAQDFSFREGVSCCLP